MKLLHLLEFCRLTGITQENFEALYDFLGGDEVCLRLKYNYRRGTPNRLIYRTITAREPRENLFLTLVRLRRGESLQDLALNFGLSKTHVSTIFYTWVQFMYLQFKRIEKEMCVTRHDQKKNKVPPCYKFFKNFRLCLDSFHIKI